ncbi:glycosyltransferase family 2 protein [Paenibacillus allorhizosphaerae]|uniref:Glycosyltransferase n=1 Tax=Paenibacillus allorhizosphaerae TaxID=2849866 RepID=A0ABM8VV59_9BACL|nr:glycosyltransferase family 2 protein [Paenibacillus allorhizosphaerae]CAG7659189.1 putative glycosyltransferase [Paenibacillus allorhizosphaerae]
MLKGVISIVVPVYNEELNIRPMYERICNTFDKCDYDFEIIYVDNCSKDNTVMEIRKLNELDARVMGITMARNFGSSQPSTMAGIHYANGNAVVIIDGDIQDPPELILEFIKKWEEGYEVVYGVRTKRKGSILRRIGYKMFYRIFKKMSYIEMPLDAGDFGLIDRIVVDEIKKLKENEIFFRGIRSWIGYKQIGVEYIRDDRNLGNTSIPFFANFKWAKMGIYNFSYKPLEWISTLSLILTMVSLLGIVYYIVLHFIYPETPYGFSTIIVLILFLGAIQLLSLSIIGEYIARIFNEVKGRPRYIVRELITRQPKEQHILEAAATLEEEKG